MATATECRHSCPKCRTTHGHPEPCAYVGGPKLCAACYARWQAAEERKAAIEHKRHVAAGPDGWTYGCDACMTATA